eukprot:scaffold2334_cov118-Cylindrotheca_fusiformis.AAC.15
MTLNNPSLGGGETIVSNPTDKTDLFATWFNFIQGLWPSPPFYNAKNSTHERVSRNNDDVDSISTRLADLLHKHISCTEFIPAEEDGYSTVPHCSQLESWDCGIACLLMVLRWLSPTQENYLSQMTPEEMSKRQALLQHINSESIWTADIVLQLQGLLENAEYVFCSKHLAVNDSYKDLGYYRTSFGADKLRVETAFTKLETSSKNLFSVECLPLELVLNAVCNPNCIAIVLLDNHVLYDNETDSEVQDNYTGHYVILCGISRASADIASAQFQDCSSGKEEEYCLVLCNVSFFFDCPSYVVDCVGGRSLTIFFLNGFSTTASES